MRSPALLLLLAGPALAGAGAEPGCPPAAARIDPELARRLDPLVERALAEGFAGGVALMRSGELVYDRVGGFSDAQRRVPVTAATLFHVASISKYLTAMLVLAAAEEGRLELDDPVAPLVPGTRLAARGVSFLDLLAHRSGLGSSYAAERKGDAAAAVAAIDRQPVDPARAGRFRYSNDGYHLLAVLLEGLYGRSYEDLAREKVLAPACLAAPRFWGEVELTDPAVVSQPLRRVRRGLRRRNYGMIGSSGLLIGAADLVRLQHAVAGGRVLSEASLGALHAPRGEMSLGQATLGAFLLEHPALGRVLSARGYEDRGENAILNHYLDRDVILAVVTSKGPAEVPGQRPSPFRSRIAAAVEELLGEMNAAPAGAAEAAAARGWAGPPPGTAGGSRGSSPGPVPAGRSRGPGPAPE